MWCISASGLHHQNINTFGYPCFTLQTFAVPAVIGYLFYRKATPRFRNYANTVVDGFTSHPVSLRCTARYRKGRSVQLLRG